MDNTTFLKSLNYTTIILIILDCITTFISVSKGNTEANILYRIGGAFMFYLIKLGFAFWIYNKNHLFEFVKQKDFFVMTYYYIFIISLLVWVNLSNLILILR